MRRYSNNLYRLIVLLLAAPSAWSSTPLRSHDPPGVEVLTFRRAIARGAAAGPMYIEIAKLERSIGHYGAALVALDHAEAAGAARTAVALERSSVHRERGDMLASMLVLDAAIAAAPWEAALRRARASARVLECDQRGAAIDGRIARELDPASFSIEDELQLAQALEISGESCAAVESLHYALAAHGPAVMLIVCVVETELRASHFDAALAAIDRLQNAGVAPFEVWRRRGVVFDRAGRPKEARAAWRQSAALIDRLPPSRRSAPAMRRRYEEIAALIETSLRDR